MTKDISDWPWPNPYLMEIIVEPEQTDRLGHTNNVRYLEWLEAIAWEHIESLGAGWELKVRLGKAMAIIRTEIDYLSASYEGDKLIVATWVTASDGRFKCARNFRIIRPRDNKTILNARMEFACISLKNGQPTKMPEPFIVALEKGLRQSQAMT